MKKFLDKYRVHIGIILILIIFGSGLFLVFEKEKLKLFESGNSGENSVNIEMENKIKDLEARVQKLEESKNESPQTVTAESENNSSKININTADQKTLESLPGIGEKRASDIILYRESNGGFKTVSEIKNIKGIGDSIYGQIKDSITVE